MTTTIDTEDRIYEMADAIEVAMETKPVGTAWTPSTAARKAKLTTDEARQALTWMHEHRYVLADGNGAWKRYYRKQRRMGD